MKSRYREHPLNKKNYEASKPNRERAADDKRKAASIKKPKIKSRTYVIERNKLAKDATIYEYSSQERRDKDLSRFSGYETLRHDGEAIVIKMI